MKKKTDYDKLRIGLKNREVCSHAIAVAIYRDLLNAYLNAHLKRYDLNLTKISTTGVNDNAGKKAAPRKRFRCKSPDLVGQTQQHNLIKNTFGKILFKKIQKIKWLFKVLAAQS